MTVLYLSYCVCLMKGYGGSHDILIMALALALNASVLLISDRNKSLKFGASVSLESEADTLLQGCCGDRKDRQLKLLYWGVIGTRSGFSMMFL